VSFNPVSEFDKAIFHLLYAFQGFPGNFCTRDATFAGEGPSDVPNRVENAFWQVGTLVALREAETDWRTNAGMDDLVRSLDVTGNGRGPRRISGRRAAQNDKRLLCSALYDLSINAYDAGQIALKIRSRRA
jgi:hypothetical protein